MLASLIEDVALEFRTQTGVQEAIRRACAANRDVASYHELGTSEEGRPIYGVVLGNGTRTVSLIAGAHADEPVGPETLRVLILQALRQRDRLRDLFAHYQFVIIPHINPDGEARNRAWIAQWPSIEGYVKHTVRELPGRDLEFGFPEMRQENRLVSSFLRAHAPFLLHMSLHGMGFAEGGMLLIERHWTFRTQALRDGFTAALQAAGLALHDHNRKGEKGFFYIEPGFTTTPEGDAMRFFFRAQGNEAMAARFHDSSMEFVRTLGGDPLCLVTELPLFVVPPVGGRPAGIPAAYLAFKARLPELRHRLDRDQPADDLLREFGVTPVDLRTLIGLQLHTLSLGLAAV